jgi:hypothetical protein
VQLKPRPTGVTILAALVVLAGLISIVFGVLFLVAVVAFLESAFLLANGIVDLLLAMGYWRGSGWAWTLGIASGVINAVGSIIQIGAGLSASIPGILLSIITVYYLTRPSVRAFFGHLPYSGRTLPMVPAMTASTDARACRSSQLLPSGSNFCKTCGTTQ